ncbi:outer membrane efflux protein, partial [Burkholderia pseudomallei Pakistan 9]
MPGWIRRTHAWIGEMPARTDRRDAQAIAPARRPDVPGAYAAAQASAAKIKAAEAEFMPKVFVSASTPYNAGRAAINAIPPVGQQAPTVNLNGSRYGGGVFVGVTIPLYDGGLRSAVLMQARNDAGSASARLERTKDEGRRTKRSGRSSPGRTRCARVSRRTMRRRRSSTPRRPLRRRARRVPARRRLAHRRDARAERPARRANRVRGQLRHRAVGRGVARARDGDG